MRQAVMAAALLLMTAQVASQDLINIRTNPLMALTGRYVNLGLDVRISDHWSVGATVQTQTDEPLYEVGMRFNHFEQGAFQQGWQSGIDVSYQRLPEAGSYFDDALERYCRWDEGTQQEVCNLSAQGYLNLGVTHGYLWRWERFNVVLGLGSEVSAPADNAAMLTLRSSLHLAIGWVR